MRFFKTSCIIVFLAKVCEVHVRFYGHLNFFYFGTALSKLTLWLAIVDLCFFFVVPVACFVPLQTRKLCSVG